MNTAYEHRPPFPQAELFDESRAEHSPRGFAIMAVLIAMLLTAAALF